MGLEERKAIELSSFLLQSDSHEFHFGLFREERLL